MSEQLELALEPPYPPLVFIACDRFGHPIARVEVDESLGHKAWHEASLWCYLAAKRAERELPAPPWVTFPC